MPGNRELILVPAATASGSAKISGDESTVLSNVILAEPALRMRSPDRPTAPWYRCWPVVVTSAASVIDSESMSRPPVVSTAPTIVVDSTVASTVSGSVSTAPTPAATVNDWDPAAPMTLTELTLEFALE